LGATLSNNDNAKDEDNKMNQSNTEIISESDENDRGEKRDAYSTRDDE